MIIEKYHINIQVLGDAIMQAQAGPNFTTGHLGLLYRNIKNNVTHASNIQYLHLTINHTKGEAEIEEIPWDKFDVFPIGYPEDPMKKIYRHICSAMTQAEDMGISKEVFI
ncbi:MAG: hypothetical protein LBU83_02450 [Bacteroidales bacterium]|jgi:hypothetical protein|nr:hypothetical protein [Bacteroidales bacterium]